MQPLSRTRSVLLAVAAALAFSIALGTANGLQTVVQERLGWSETAARLLQAAGCTAITLAGVVLLARIHHRPLSWIGLRRRRVLIDLGTGLVVVATAAVVVLGPTLAAGGVRVQSVDPGALLVFLVLTVVVAAGHEAVPEELAFRGLAFSALRERASTLLAGLVMSVIFVLSSGVSNVVYSLIVRATGVGTPPWYTVAPPGEDPVVYVVFLLLWSCCLIAARLATGSLWTPMAAHLLLLILNRLVIGTGTGLTVQLADPSVALVLPAYLLVATLGFLGLRAYRVRSDRSGPVVSARVHARG